MAKGVVQHQFGFAEFDAHRFEVADFYHPIVLQAVRNTFRLPPGENVALLISPNMAGKSTLLKALGLCVYPGPPGPWRAGYHVRTALLRHHCRRH